MPELKTRAGSITLSPPETTPHAMPRSQAAEIRRDVAPKSLYVYLTSGAISIVPAITEVSMTEDRMLLLRDGETVAEYPRSSVFFASRQRECPPGP